MEEAVIRTLDDFGVTGHLASRAPWHLRCGWTIPWPRPAAAKAPPKTRGTAQNRFHRPGQDRALGIRLSRHCLPRCGAQRGHGHRAPTAGSALAVTQVCKPWTFSTIGVSTTWEKPRRCWANSSACAQRPDSPRRPHAMSTPEQGVVREASIHRSLQPLGQTEAAAKLSHSDQRSNKAKCSETRLDSREGGQPPPRASTKSRKSCASTSCTVCEKPPAQRWRVLWQGTATFMIMGDKCTRRCPVLRRGPWPLTRWTGRSR